MIVVPSVAVVAVVVVKVRILAINVQNLFF